MNLRAIRFLLACSVYLICCDSFAQDKPLKVFLLVGQSNMQGHADVRTLEHLGMAESTQPVLAEILDSNGKAKRVDDVWISYLSSSGVKSGQLTTGFGANENKIGPELAFGIYMQKRLGEPILIIKAAWGGKSLNTDFRSPSAGPYEFNEATLKRFAEQKKDVAKIKMDKAQATGIFYKKAVEHVKTSLANIGEIVPGYDARQGYELAGMVWFQGWNDMVDGGTYPRRNEKDGYRQYSECLAHFIRDFRMELNAPKLPFVIGVMGVGGPTAKYSKSQQRYKSTHQGFRDAMARPATMKEFVGNVAVVLTENCWDMELDSVVRREDEFRGKVKRMIKDEKIDELAKLISPKTGLNELDTVKTELLQLKDRRDFSRVVLQRVIKSRFSNHEREILSKGKSNAAYHYLGSAKIMTCIGKAFAEAMPVQESN